MDNKNRITNPGFTYDDAGNLTSDGFLSYTWDAENRLTATNNVSYTYDGDGRRVNKSSGTLYWYGVNGQVLEETDLSGNLLNDYIYFNGQRIARVDASGGKYSYFTDPLGSTALVWGPGGTKQELDYYPFGGERVITSTLENHYKFTGMERDAESGLDHTLYRQYASNLGRWLSPDPDGGSVSNPQSLNRYGYVSNNPTNFIDPLGLYRYREYERGGGIWPRDPLFGDLYDAFFGSGTGSPNLPPGEGSGSSSFAGARNTLRRAAKELAKRDFTKKPDCMKDLELLGVTAAQVQQGCTDAVFLNGIGSDVSRASLYANSPIEAIRGAPGVTRTVGDFFAANPGVVAQAELGGSDIYINPALITGSDFYGNQGLVLHEVLHNVTGLTDDDMKRALGLPEAAPSKVIADRLVKDCL